MNSRQLKKLGVPDDCVKSAIVAIQAATKTGGLKAAIFRAMFIGR